MMRDDEKRADNEITTASPSWNNLQELEGGEANRERFDKNDDNPSTQIAIEAAAVNHVPQTDRPREATLQKTKKYDDIPNDKVQNLSLAPGVDASLHENIQQRSHWSKSQEKNELQLLQPRMSISNDHDHDIEENDHKTFPGAVSVEGQRIRTNHAPSQEREPLPPVVYAAVVHTDDNHDDDEDDDDDGKYAHTTNQQPPPATAVLVDKEGPCGISKRSWLCCAFGFLLAITVAIVVGVVMTLNQGGNSPEAPTVLPTKGPTENAPNSPTNAPSQKVFTYPKSAPKVHGEGGGSFDHLEDMGYFASGESLIDKITQLRVYITNFCVTNNDCSLPTALQLSLVVSYAKQDSCTSIESKTQGAYTEGAPIATLNFPRDVYLTRMEFSLEYLTICDSTLTCKTIGPYNGTKPDMVFEMNNSAIKAFYGMSGSWVDSVGVYYDSFGQSTSNCN